MKQLNNYFNLDNNIKIYIPSTTNVDKKINNKKQVNKTLAFLSTKFGGCTATKSVGSWITKQNKLVTENVTICYSFCDKSNLNKSITEIIDYCNDLKNDLKQEAVSLEINNKIYFI